MGLQASSASKQALAAVGSDVMFQISRSAHAIASQSVVAGFVSQRCKDAKGNALVHPHWAQRVFLGTVSVLFCDEIAEGKNFVRGVLGFNHRLRRLTQIFLVDIPIASTNRV